MGTKSEVIARQYGEVIPARKRRNARRARFQELKKGFTLLVFLGLVWALAIAVNNSRSAKEYSRNVCLVTTGTEDCRGR